MTRPWALRDCPIKVQARLAGRRPPRVSCTTCEVDKDWCYRFRRGDASVSAGPVVESMFSSLYQAWFKASCRGVRKAARKRERQRRAKLSR